ncbi:hypothetical protein ACNPMZ_00865 [Acinetobacter pittii]|uniref:hypothetical protein n=1 Tax=Acinetobacter pittii TaxID=48296 RepID=UPI003AA7BDB3
MNQTKDELIEHLQEHIAFLTASSISFDSGFLAEAKRMATSIRVLLHDTASSKSLLGLLDIKDKILFINKAEPFDGNSMVSHLGLVAMRPYNASYCALLDDIPPYPDLKPLKHFDEWWNEIVIKDNSGEEFTRKSLVLNLANKDGGAHVDPKLNSSYANLTRNNSAGWFSFTSEGGETPFKDIELHSIRQIAHELTSTLTAIDLSAI